MVLLETSVFTQQIVELLGDDEYLKLQVRLSTYPESGVLIRGGGGIRKIRISARSHGTSGGGRVIYYWAKSSDQILFLFAYAKNVTGDLTPKQIAALAKLVKKEFGA